MSWEVGHNLHDYIAISKKMVYLCDHKIIERHEERRNTRVIPEL